MPAEPRVIHYLWHWATMGKEIIACGKRNVFGDLFTTKEKDLVTCTRCQNTQRFKGSTEREGRRKIQLTFVVNDDGDVSPDYLAQRVATACFTYYVLRGNEGIELPSDPTKLLVDASQTK